eukprot:scaffold6778_cov97-Skeletonema_dohrnii-CCMP3373.AAC.3
MVGEYFKQMLENVDQIYLRKNDKKRSSRSSSPRPTETIQIQWSMPTSDPTSGSIDVRMDHTAT